MLLRACISHGRKTVGDVFDKVAARDAMNFTWTKWVKNRRAGKRKLDVQSLRTLLMAEHAFAPASQSEPELKTREEPWDEWRDRWSPQAHKHMFRFSREDMNRMLPLFDINEHQEHRTRRG